jgi:hypothetical protein
LWLSIPAECFFAIGAASTFLAAAILLLMGRGRGASAEG